MNDDHNPRGVGRLRPFTDDCHRSREKVGRQGIDRFFEDYLTVCRDQRLIEVADRGSTDVFPDSVAGRLPLSVIRQLCVYANRIYIHDPVIELADHFGTLDTHFERIMRTPNRAERLADFRSEFAETLEQLLELRPLIALGVVHVAPSQLLQRKREPCGSICI